MRGATAVCYTPAMPRPLPARPQPLLALACLLVAGACAQKPQADATAAAPDAGAAPSGPHALHPLSKWGGPFTFKPTDYLPEATALAQKQFPDAVLVHARFSRVLPRDGINLKNKDSFAAYRFRSPSRSKTPNTVCLIDVVVTTEGVQVTSPNAPGIGCDTPALSLPPCELTRLWRTAIKEAIPTEAVGTYELLPSTPAAGDVPTTGRWKLNFPTKNEAIFERVYDEACQPIGQVVPVRLMDPSRLGAPSPDAGTP